MAAPAVRSVPALATLRIEVKRFRLGAGVVLIFIRVEFSGLMNLRREDYKTVIPTKLFFADFTAFGKNASYTPGDLHVSIRVDSICTPKFRNFTMEVSVRLFNLG